MKLKIMNKKSDNFVTSMLIMLGYKIHPEFSRLFKFNHIPESDISFIKVKADLFLDSFTYLQNNNWFKRFTYSIEDLKSEIKIRINLETHTGVEETISCIYSYAFDGVVDTELRLDFNQ